MFPENERSKHGTGRKCLLITITRRKGGVGGRKQTPVIISNRVTTLWCVSGVHSILLSFMTCGEQMMAEGFICHGGGWVGGVWGGERYMQMRLRSKRTTSNMDQWSAECSYPSEAGYRRTATDILRTQTHKEAGCYFKALLDREFNSRSGSTKVISWTANETKAGAQMQTVLACFMLPSFPSSSFYGRHLIFFFFSPAF